MRKPDFGNVMSGVIALSAVVPAGSLVYRNISVQPTKPNTGRPTFVDFWEEALPASIPLAGNTSAPIKVLVLSDLECPACRAFHEVIRAITAERPNDVQILYVGYPLTTIHRFARAAALGAECAARMNAFTKWVDVVYHKQDSLGFKSWGSYARDAEISDTVAFTHCTTGAAAFPRLTQGESFGRRLGNPGTPTVLMNGWHFPQPPNLEVMLRSIDALKKGNSLEGESFAVPLGAWEAR